MQTFGARVEGVKGAEDVAQGVGVPGAGARPAPESFETVGDDRGAGTP